VNSQQRKIIRDGHLNRLGGNGADVWVDGKHKAKLASIDGADRASIYFVARNTPAHLCSQFIYKAERLTPR